MRTAIRWTRPADRRAFRREVAHTITFDALPGNRTLMRVHEAGYASAEPLEMSRQGLEQSLDKLTPLFVGGRVAL